MLKSFFFSQTPENLNNPENFIFSGLSGVSSVGRKNWLQIWNLHPKKHLLEKEKDVFFYMCMK